MTTTTVASNQSHLSAEEIAKLNKPGHDAKWWLGTVGTVVGMGAIVLYCVLPFYWMIVSSLRLPTMGMSNDLLPNPPSLENFAAVFAPANNFGRALLNSILISAVTTILTLLFGVLGAYSLARLRFPLKALVLALIIGCSMFPGITLLVPLLKMFSGVYPWFPNWMNTYQALIIPSLSFGLPLCVWNLTSYFRQLPVELEHSAMVDGCTPAQAFRLIIMPLAAPGVFTTAILVFIAVWNEFMIANTFGTTKDMFTAPVAVNRFTGSLGFNTPFGTIMAAGVLITVPLIFLVLAFQRRIIGGLAAGALK
jgi:multiple sugar transport system permease protein